MATGGGGPVQAFVEQFGVKICDLAKEIEADMIKITDIVNCNVPKGMTPAEWLRPTTTTTFTRSTTTSTVTTKKQANKQKTQRKQMKNTTGLSAVFEDQLSV